MAPKRPLGLAKAAKSKKKKTVDEPESVDQTTADVNGAEDNAQEGNELTVELGEEIDPNDAVGQLAELWRTYFSSEDRKELVLNGIIHECDRILRKAHSDTSEKEDEENVEITGRFYAIYALALSNLAYFKTDDSDKVSAFFLEAMDRIDIGEKLFPDSIDIHFAKARIMINRIPLTLISKMDSKSSMGDFEDAGKLLDECLAQWEKAEELTSQQNQYDFYNFESLDFLQVLDDLLDVVENFGHELPEGADSDNEEDNEAGEDFKLDEKHPLYSIKSTNKYSKWWRNHLIIFLQNLDKRLATSEKKPKDHPLNTLRRELCRRLGQSFLIEAEIPANVYTTLSYYAKDEKTINGLSKEEAQKQSQDLFNSALYYLRESQDKEEPETWVNVAEAMISLGNVYDLDSPEQEKAYKEAEEILVKANNATNGKFDDILENLLHS